MNARFIVLIFLTVSPCGALTKRLKLDLSSLLFLY